MADENPLAEIRRAVPRVVEAIATVPWAITDEMMDTIVAIASRANEIEPQALEAYRAKHLANAENAALRGNVGIMTVRGPIFRYADMFTAFSGGSTYEGLALDLQAMEDNPTVRSAIAWFDSPGGEVNGCSEAAEAIRNFSKPIVAYVGGQACSAAYWLASACDEIVISNSAILGSIGVRMSLRDTKDRDAKSGVRTFEFISSRAPNKRTEPDTDEGRARIQKMADALEAVFVSAVASYRGVTDDEVVANFGGGGVEIGADAVSVGLADALGSFEGLVAKMQSGQFRQSNVRRNLRMANTPAATTADQPVTFTQAQVDQMVSAARQEGASAGSAEAATRLSAILGCDEAKDRPKLAAHYAYKTTMSADDAKAALAVAGKETVETPAPVVAAPAATTTVVAPTGQRAQDAAGGLALAGLNEKQEPEKKPAAINSSSIYNKRREAETKASR